MKKFDSYLIKTGFLAASLSFATPVLAQNTLPDGISPMLIAPQQQTVSHMERTLCYDIAANVDYTIASDADWATVRKADDGSVYIYVKQNDSGSERTAKITFANAENSLSCTLVLTQKRDDFSEGIPSNIQSYGIFGDEVCSSLKDGVTQADVDTIASPSVRALAGQLLAGTYVKDYRVAEYECLLSPNTLSQQWNADGKYYDQYQGVTGINISKGSQGIIVSGIPSDVSVQLKVVAWWVGRIGSNFDGGDPNTTTYDLHNGLNIINYNYDYDGLAYVSYYTTGDPDNYAPIKVHFVNGDINGYLSKDKTNEEMYELCGKARNYCMDVVGNKAHSIWTAEGLHKYCKGYDQERNVETDLGYLQYINLLDSLVVWEQRLLGLEKYDRVPKNKTMAYVNFTYYMFQGGYGVSFHVDQESRVLNCRRLIRDDDDAIWGLSHEWGHQHQMSPYFCWAGLSEVTNNMNSYYNIMKMGYRTSDKINQWEPARRDFNFYGSSSYNSGTSISSPRRDMYQYVQGSSAYNYSQDMRDLCLSMSDSAIHSFDDPTRALAYTEVSVGETLAPFIMLYNYFSHFAPGEDRKPDFALDWYEALRQSDDANGSTVEKQDGVDKYELICSAQNYNKNGKYAVFAEKYPNSCWVTENYLNRGNVSWYDNSVPAVLNYVRKVSRLSGYNLFPYFEAWGFLRVIGLRIGDYGNKNYVMTQKMYDEFKADMDALVQEGVLKEMPADLVNTIACGTFNSDNGNWFQDKPIISAE